MAKGKVVRKNSKAWRAYKKRQKQAIFVVTCLFVLASSLFFINSNAVNQQTTETLKIKTSADIRAIAKAMTTRVGNPAFQRRDNTGAHYYLAFSVTNERQATGLRNGLRNGSQSKPELWQLTQQSAPASFHSLGTDFKEQVSSDTFLDKKTGAKCRITYVYYPSSYDLSGYPRFDIHSSGILLVDIGC